MLKYNFQKSKTGLKDILKNSCMWTIRNTEMNLLIVQNCLMSYKTRKSNVWESPFSTGLKSMVPLSNKMLPITTHALLLTSTLTKLSNRKQAKVHTPTTRGNPRRALHPRDTQ